MNKKVEIQIVKSKALSGMVRFNVMKSFCLLYGGASCIDLQGVWIDSKCDCHTDYSWLIYTYCSAFNKDSMVDLARSIAIQLNEQAVMLVLDGECLFVGKD